MMASFVPVPQGGIQDDFGFACEAGEGAREARGHDCMECSPKQMRHTWLRVHCALEHPVPLKLKQICE
eukprot:3125037-Amphidinium_carterae.1